jgi:hypothetical protein
MALLKAWAVFSRFELLGPNKLQPMVAENKIKRGNSRRIYVFKLDDILAFLQYENSGK